MSVKVNDKEIKGTIAKKENTLIEYRNNLIKGDTVCKVEGVSDNSEQFELLVSHIGNILPDDSINVTFSFIQQLDISCSKKFILTIPLTLIPRYFPTNSMKDILKPFIARYVIRKKCKDKIKYIKHNKQLDYCFDAKVSIYSSIQIKKVESLMKTPTIIQRIDDNNYLVTLDNRKFNVPNEDFSISYEIDEYELLKPKFLLTKHPKYQNDYAFWYTYSVNKGFSDIRFKQIKTNFIFCVDRSGSMKGSKLENTKTALKTSLNSLPPYTSTFNIISFGSITVPMFPSLVPVNNKEIKEKAIEKINLFEADLLGTAIKPSLNYIRHYIKNSNSPTRVFILTDGAVFDTEECLNLIKRMVEEYPIRFYSLGIGDGCCEKLVRGIAENGGGKFAFARNDININQNILDLLESSLKQDINNYKIELKRKPNVLLSNIGKYTTKRLSLDEIVSVYGILPKEYVENNEIICSFSCSNYPQLKVENKIKFDISHVVQTDILHKIIIGNFYIDNENLCLKYQILSNNTSLYCVIKENVLSKEELAKKVVLTIKRIPPKEDFKVVCQNFISPREVEEILLCPYEPISRKWSLYYEKKSEWIHHTLIEFEYGRNILVYKNNKHVLTIEADRYLTYTYDNIISHIVQELKLKREKYDFIEEFNFIKDMNKEVTFSDRSPYKVIQIVKKYREYNKEDEKYLAIERLFQNQEMNELWELNDYNLYLLGFSRKGWKKFLKEKETMIKKQLINDEVILLNMYIIAHCYRAPIDNSEIINEILDDAEKAIKKKWPSYDKHFGYQFIQRNTKNTHISFIRLF